MKTEALIRELASECRPVKPLENPAFRFIKWAVASTAIVSAGVLLWRPGLGLDLFTDPAFMLLPAFLLFVSLCCGAAAFILTVPDKKYLKVDLLFGTIIVLWGCYMAYLFLNSDFSNTDHGYNCIARTVIFASAPSALLFRMLKKAAPIKSGTVGLLACLAAVSLAGIGAQFLCQKQLPAHILIWHLAPVCLSAGIGFLLGRVIFKWSRA